MNEPIADDKGSDVPMEIPPLIVDLPQAALVEDNSANHEELFSTARLQADLKGRSVRGGMITMSAQGAKFILNIVSTMALSRLLLPAEFGVVAMVTPITGFISMFKDLGLSMATVQKQTINHKQVSTLFWVNVVVSLFLGLVVAGISPVVGWFYHDSRTTWVTLASASTFLLGGLTAQHSALLARNMRFGVLAFIDIATMGSSIAAAIIAARLGWSYWSLVVMTIVGGVVNCAAVWLASPWRPGRPMRNVGTRSMLTFGGGMALASVLEYICVQMDRVILGKFYNPPGVAGPEELVVKRAEALGLYSRSLVLFITPFIQVMSPLNSVMIPLFSRLAHEPKRLSSAASRIMELATALVLPISLMSFLSADELIGVLLGSNPQWAGAAALIRAFSIVAVTMPISLVVNAIFVGTGRSDVLIKWEAFWFVVLVSSLVLGLHWGPLGVAFAVGWAGFFVAPIHLYIGYRVAHIDLWHVGKILLRSCASIVLCCGAVLLIKQFTGGLPVLARAIINLSTICLIHLFFLYIFGTLSRAKQLILNRREVIAVEASS